MSERNKRTPWDDELEAQVLAEQQAKRKQANAEQLAAYDVLSNEQEAKPPAPPANVDDSDLAELLAIADKPLPKPEKPSLGIEIDRSTFADEDSAVTHFERAFAPGNEAENLWTRLESHFGAKELRIYLGTAVLIVVVLLFSFWFNNLATRQMAARAAAEEQVQLNEAAMQEATGGADTAE